MMRAEGLRLSSLKAMAAFLLSSFATNGSQQIQAINMPTTTEPATGTSGGKRSGTVAQAKRAALKLKRRKAHRRACK